MRARLVVSVTPADVGRRVTVRARYHGPRARAIDVVGILEQWRDGTLTITRRDGTTAHVAEADLLAARVVDEPPAQRRRSTHPHDPTP